MSGPDVPDANINGYSYDDLMAIVNFLQSKLVSLKPKVAIICGSGLGSITDIIENQISLPYEEIPNFPVSTVAGHGGCLVFGILSNVPVMCLKGRFHFYEGYPLWKCCMPIRIMKLLGCSHLIVTNAAGGINQNFKIGDVMLIKDHVNFMGFAGNNPLRGPNEERFGTRFPGMNKAYDKDLIKAALDIAKGLNIEDKVHQGVYASVGGPNYETVAELKLMQTLGIDAVGMSTVPEVIVAKHSNLSVFAFSLITNECVLDWDSHKEPNHEEVLKATQNMEVVLQNFVKQIIEYIGKITCVCKQ
ncbi:purine nucleoside phosphorylase-like [Diorhabda carinulata]|uniref:purine nucleoside phosphorylase-like n=1 Tax=Diorhabda carinulata TaxID=1163345 RepID=UPI0025A1C6B5|nr:purine nucleoside phosphorylase-like [Diorhabda carinulata]XP_057658763.1 purine nucleoside phosphorylase-like [Diorhabda carinulata]